MSKEEIALMPMGFIKKYGSYLNKVKTNSKDFHLDENKKIYDYFDQIKRLQKLQTSEEKSQMIKEF